MSTTTDTDIMCALIGQVASASKGQPEYTVRTIISRPMWNSFLRATGTPENTAPTAWLGAKNTHRVYGSETIVIESEEMFSVSFRP